MPCSGSGYLSFKTTAKTIHAVVAKDFRSDHSPIKRKGSMCAFGRDYYQPTENQVLHKAESEPDNCCSSMQVNLMGVTVLSHLEFSVVVWLIQFLTFLLEFVSANC